eukprot:216877-Chlamydomonas_euryale.AAC.5
MSDAELQQLAQYKCTKNVERRNGSIFCGHHKNWDTKAGKYYVAGNKVKQTNRKKISLSVLGSIKDIFRKKNKVHVSSSPPAHLQAPGQAPAALQVQQMQPGVHEEVNTVWNNLQESTDKTLQDPRQSQNRTRGANPALTDQQIRYICEQADIQVSTLFTQKVNFQPVWARAQAVCIPTVWLTPKHRQRL